MTANFTALSRIVELAAWLAVSSVLSVSLAATPSGAVGEPKDKTIVLRAARLLDIDGGRIIGPAEVLIRDDRISAVDRTVPHPVGAYVLDLGNRTLLPGLID